MPDKNFLPLYLTGPALYAWRTSLDTPSFLLQQLSLDRKLSLLAPKFFELERA